MRRGRWQRLHVLLMLPSHFLWAPQFTTSCVQLPTPTPALASALQAYRCEGALDKQPETQVLVPMRPLLCWVIWSKLLNLIAKVQCSETLESLFMQGQKQVQKVITVFIKGFMLTQ